MNLSPRATLTLSLLLLTISLPLALSSAPAEARGGHGGVRGGSMGRPTNSGHITGSPFRLGMFGRGRGRGRGYWGNSGVNPDAEQAAYFDQRRNENPYSSVPQHVRVSDYIKNY